MENTFYVGQRVVYITGFNMPKGSIHTIRAINTEPCVCGEVMIKIDVDAGPIIEPEDMDADLVECCECKCTLPISAWLPTYLFWYASSFAPLSEKTAESESFATETLKNIEHEIIETYTVK